MTARPVALSSSPRKYRNAPIVVDGERFDSHGEAMRYSALQLLQRCGEIRYLRRQVRLPLHAHNAGAALVGEVGVYVADFVYAESRTVNGEQTWQPVIEDFKGHDTPLSRWKRRHVALEYGHDVRLSRAK